MLFKIDNWLKQLSFFSGGKVVVAKKCCTCGVEGHLFSCENGGCKHYMCVDHLQRAYPVKWDAPKFWCLHHELP